MKLDRLLAITTTLLNNQKVSARELAERFEVTERTIYRDIEAINQAGIPVVAYRGSSGGFGLAEGFRLDKSVLTSDEMASIVSALKSASSTYRDSNAAAVMEKIRSIIPTSQSESFRAKTEQWYIDYSSWGDDYLLKERIECLKTAIELQKTVCFDYLGNKRELTRREVEPHTLVLKSRSWYLYGYCRLRDDFRVFKLARMRELTQTGTTFQRREIDLESLPWERGWERAGKTVTLVLRFDAEFRMVVEDMFESRRVEIDPRGRSVVEVTYPDEDWVYGFVLSFGPFVEVLSPPHIRQGIIGAVERMRKKYR
ncbi:MAG: YafY family transcriptional regulator [Firmicutes bacterium]|nr:YafY family transcriptional regulator [Bacillota bacterium]